MPSFDIVSKFDWAELDNAINNTKKAIATRFDFRGVQAEIELDRKEKQLKFSTEDGTKHAAMREMFLQSVMRRNLDAKAFEFKEPEPGAAGALKRFVKIKEGIEQPIAKDIVARIKEQKMKVQASIQGDEVRVTSKSIDDLQAVMKLLDAGELKIPLQYVNMKRD
ncbi:YajQ family cyclic di-GMP-binding protein [soil metagenome]